MELRKLARGERSALREKEAELLKQYRGAKAQVKLVCEYAKQKRLKAQSIFNKI